MKKEVTVYDANIQPLHVGDIVKGIAHGTTRNPNHKRIEGVITDINEYGGVTIKCGNEYEYQIPTYDKNYDCYTLSGIASDSYWYFEKI